MAREFLKQKDNNSVLVVDALNLAFRWKHSGAKQFAAEYLNTVKSFARSYGCGKIILAADQGNSTYRKAIDPEYKANRKALRENQTEKEKQDFIDFIQEFENTLLQAEELEDMPVIRFQGVEADDIAAFICKYKNDYSIETIWLISTDRDWDLLLTDSIHRFSYINRKEFKISNWEEHYDVPQDMYLTFKALTGDKGDNVPGITQVGPKRATTLIEQYGDVFDIYNSLPLSGTNKYIQNLNDSGNRLLINVELMGLLEFCEKAIGEDNCMFLRERIEQI